MDRLLARLSSALSGVPRSPVPPPVDPSRAAIGDDLVGAFEAALVDAGGRLVRVQDDDAARAWLDKEAGENLVVFLHDEPPEAVLRVADVGVDRAGILIAETGTVVATHATRHAARVSLLPPTTVFVATRDQLVRDLPSALTRLAPLHRRGRAYSVLVTGPSRTADIEKELVIPAHGPRDLIVLLLEG